MNTINLGSKVVVSDPCYKLGTWCAGVLENVLPGEYNCDICIEDAGRWGNRVSHLYVVHKDYNIRLCEINEEQEFEVGVDSGTAGVFDYDYYAKYHTTEDIDDDWYTQHICNAFYPGFDSSTWNKYILTHYKGFVSQSGYGDGGYTCYVKRNDNGQIIAIMIEYISFKDDEYEEEYDENDYCND